MKELKFMDVQILTRGQLPGLNRRGPIPKITLDLATVCDLIKMGVEVCNMNSVALIVDPVTRLPVVSPVQVVGAPAKVEESPVNDAESAANTETEKEPEADATETTEEAEETEESGEETDTEATPGQALTPDGIPVYVPDPKLSKNQQNKARKAYYKKMREEKEAAEKAAAAAAKEAEVVGTGTTDVPPAEETPAEAAPVESAPAEEQPAPKGLIGTNDTGN